MFSVGKVPCGCRKGEKGEYTAVRIRLAIYIYIYIYIYVAKSLAGEKWTNHIMFLGFDKKSIFPTTQRTQVFEIPQHREESHSYSVGLHRVIRLFLDSGIRKLFPTNETVTRKISSSAVLISPTATFAIHIDNYDFAVRTGVTKIIRSVSR